MKSRLTIAGEPVLEIYGYHNGRHWFITKKIQRCGHFFLSGYVHCFKPLILTEFNHLPVEVLEDMSNSIWKVSRDAWHRCPCVDIDNEAEQCKIVHLNGRDADSRPLGSYSNIFCKEVDEKMDADTRERLDDYIELLDEISEKTDDASTAVALLHEICKDRRSQQMRNEREAKSNNKVTFKQKRCMKRLGIDFPDDITRKEASVLIKEELARLNGVGE